MCFIDVRWIRIATGVILPALLAASVEALEFNPDLLFGAARAFSCDVGDTQETYLRIAGVKKITHRSLISLAGSRTAAEPNPTQQSLDAAIDGRLEGGYRVEGRLLQSEGLSGADRTTLCVSREGEAVAIGDLAQLPGGTFLPSVSHVRGVKIRKNTGTISIEGLVSTPQTVMRTEYVRGDGTQGPYRLSYIPIAERTESIVRITGLIEEVVPAHAYRLDCDTGNLTFTNDLIGRGELIRVTYQQKGSWEGESLRTLWASCCPRDSVRATVRVASRACANESSEDTYSVWELQTKTTCVEIEGEVAFQHSGADPCRPAGSNVRLAADSDRLKVETRCFRIASSLGLLWGFDKQEKEDEVEVNATLNLVGPSKAFLRHLVRTRGKQTGTNMTYGLSIGLPASSSIKFERTEDTHTEGSTVHNDLTLSRETSSHKVTLLVSQGDFNRDKRTRYASAIDAKLNGSTQMRISADYLMSDNQDRQLDLACEMSTESDMFGHALFSSRLTRSSVDGYRRIVHVDVRGREAKPFELTAEYNLRCLNTEGQDRLPFRETHELNGSAKIGLSGISLAYCPCLNYSRGPELVQHRLVSQWSLTTRLSIGASADRSKHRTPVGDSAPYETEALKLSCRLLPTPSTRADAEYRNNKRLNALSSLACLEKSCRLRISRTIREGASIHVGLSKSETIEGEIEGNERSRHDTTIEARGAAQLNALLTAYLEAGFTRRDAINTGYARSSGVGLRLSSESGMTADFCYRTVMWENAPEGDTDKVALWINTAETWLSSKFGLEYTSLTRPISRILEISLDASLHF